MKWGHRKSGTGPASTHVKGESSPDHKLSRELKAKPLHTLSDSEIKKLNNRLQLERSARDLNKSTVNKGHDKVKAILAVGTTLASAYALVNSPAGKAARDAIVKGAKAARAAGAAAGG